MQTPTYAELAAAHQKAEAARLALAADLRTTQVQLYREQTLRRLPHLEPVIDLVSGSNADEYAARADELDAALTAARALNARRTP